MVDLDSIKPGYTIRSDILGFYLCTMTEAEETDTGTSASAGYDLRSHWETLEEAISALKNWKPESSTLYRAMPTSTARKPLMTDTVLRLNIHSQGPAKIDTPIAWHTAVA